MVLSGIDSWFMCPGMYIGSDSLTLGSDCACAVVSILSNGGVCCSVDVCPMFIGGDLGMLLFAGGCCACAGVNVVACDVVACPVVSSSWCC